MKKSRLTIFVKEKRKQYGLTQRDLAYKSGVGLRFVREMEQGKTTIKMDKVNQVLSLFGASLAPLPDISDRTENVEPKAISS